MDFNFRKYPGLGYDPETSELADCDCDCHTTPGMVHFIACCHNGKVVVRKLDEQDKKDIEEIDKQIAEYTKLVNEQGPRKPDESMVDYMKFLQHLQNLIWQRNIILNGGEIKFQ